MVEDDPIMNWLDPVTGELRLPMPAPMPRWGKRHLLIRQPLTTGMRPDNVAGGCEVTTRYVRRIKAEMKAARADTCA